MNSDTLKLRAVSAPWYAGVQFLIRDGKHVGSNITMIERDVGSIVEPTFTLSREAAQTLMDDLWNAGLRPTEGSGSAGSLRATERHLEDMRTIATKLLDGSLAQITQRGPQ